MAGTGSTRPQSPVTDGGRGWRRVDSASDGPGLAVARGSGFHDGFEATVVLHREALGLTL